MKKFSKLSKYDIPELKSHDGEKHSNKDFKFQVMELMDNLLSIQMYGPITRYYAAGDMKISGKELFAEALEDLIQRDNSSRVVKILEELKFDSTDWKSIDDKINQVLEKKSNTEMQLLDLFNKYGEDLGIQVFENRINNTKSVKILNRMYKEISESKNVRIKEIILNRLNSLK